MQADVRSHRRPRSRVQTIKSGVPPPDPVTDTWSAAAGILLLADSRQEPRPTPVSNAPVARDGAPPTGSDEPRRRTSRCPRSPAAASFRAEAELPRLSPVSNRRPCMAPERSIFPQPSHSPELTEQPWRHPELWVRRRQPQRPSESPRRRSSSRAQDDHEQIPCHGIWRVPPPRLLLVLFSVLDSSSPPSCIQFLRLG